MTVDPALLGARMVALDRIITGHRYRYATEAELQEQLERVLLEAGVPVRREVRLTPRDRIDLLAGDVGIEVKVKGTRNPLQQLARYAQSPEVAGLLLVTTRASSLPDALNDKPLRLVSLLTNGLA